MELKKSAKKTSRFIFLIFVIFTACTENPKEKSELNTEQTKIVFNEDKWKTKDARDYPYRNEMLHDLMNNQNLRKLNRKEILNLLGDPDRIDNDCLFYRIEQKRLGFLPLHTKTMVIKFENDSTVHWVKIHE
ncbi:MAG TPA: hypothetical protein VFM70_10800 [Salinimicrobium sp.]|nr:hypothetical protein [Salinimicrobium sp.]